MIMNVWAIEQQMQFRLGICKIMFIQKNNSKFTYETTNCELIVTSLEEGCDHI